MTKEKTIEQRFRKLDDISHCLQRPGMYVGSIKTREEEVYLLNDQGKFTKRLVQVNPAFMKIFDEIVSNAADEHRRNTKLNQITITTDKTTGRITVLDNGGIPVVKHKDHDEWVPEMIFANLKAGSNFNDTEERLVAGTNGVGATLTNIFSTEFRIRTCDGKQEFDQIFTGNMRNKSKPEICKGSKGFTEISFIPDVQRFGLEGLDDDHIEIMRKRCADIAACNPLIRVEFNSERFNFSSFSAYCRLYTDNVFYEGSERWRIAIGASNGSMQQISFVNGVETKDGGTHVDFVVNQIVEAIRTRLKKKHKVELKPAEIRNHMFVFVSADIVNSSFSSQTKEKMITDPRDFGSKHELSDKFLKQVCESEMIQRILDWHQQKSLAEERKKLRELNKQISREKVLKLIDAKSKNREECTLALFEGDCLRDDTEVIVYRAEYGHSKIKISDIKVGDYVITHTNTLKQVAATSSKLSKLYCAKTPQGTVNASGSHRMWVYDTEKNEFTFVRFDELLPGRHRFVKNKLHTASYFMHVKLVSQTDKDIIVTCDEEVLVASPTHKFATFDVSNNQFGMTEAADLQPEKHYLVLNHTE